MSRETEKVFKELHKYINEHSDESRSQEDIEKLIGEFMGHYNGNIPGPVTRETASDSDDFLELAYEAGNEKDALKYAKQALKLDPYNFEAELLILDLKANDATKLVRDLEKAVVRATEHMREEGYFDEENIGHFWGILETRPYMRMRARFVHGLLVCGMLGRAREECEELLRLSEGDNLGMRYLLMHILAYFEDETSALALHKRFDSYEETQMLLPLSILFYKKGDFTKASRYLLKLNGINKDLRRFLRVVLSGNVDAFDDVEYDLGYCPDSIGELVVEMRDNAFLFIGMENYFEWAYQQIKKKR